MTEHRETLPPPLTGTMLGNRYRLVSRIAGGGMGEVWRGVDEVLGRTVAIKILRREYADDATFRERFRAEGRHTANLAHPAVAAVYDFSDGDGVSSPYLVMECVDGEPLSTVIARDGALPLDRTLEIIGQAAGGLQAAHDAGVIHRDIKPANILVTDTGVKITDFGIARATNSVPLTQTGAIMGTAYYISPEQASGGSVTPASDLYSLGVVAYECISGRRPFAGDTPVSVALAQVRQPPPPLPESVPPDVRDLVMSLLAKDPAARPPSAGEVARRALALAPRYRDSAGPTGHLAATAVLPAGAAPPLGAESRLRDRAADTNPGFVLPAEARGRWAPYAIGLALLLVVLLLVARGCADDGEAPTDEPTRQEPAATRTVEVVAADLIGRPVGDVQAELAELGLRVALQEAGGGAPVGTVKDVDPTGELAVGSTVTVVWVAGPGDEDQGNGDEDKKREEEQKKREEERKKQEEERKKQEEQKKDEKGEGDEG